MPYSANSKAQKMSGKITFANSAAEKLLGIPKIELCAMSFDSFLEKHVTTKKIKTDLIQSEKGSKNISALFYRLSLVAAEPIRQS